VVVFQHSQHGPDDGPWSMTIFSDRFMAASSFNALSLGGCERSIHGCWLADAATIVSATAHNRCMFGYEPPLVPESSGGVTELSYLFKARKLESSIM
jgi:hypothetical protein